MKVHELTNLFIGYNEEEDFRILIMAEDEATASEIAEEYCVDSKLEGHFEILECDDDIGELHFDCDYVVS